MHTLIIKEIIGPFTYTRENKSRLNYVASYPKHEHTRTCINGQFLLRRDLFWHRRNAFSHVSRD